MHTIDMQIEKLIDTALAQKIVSFNKHGVGGFYLTIDQLPDGITFDRHGLYDATLLNGNGVAQIRKRKRGPISCVFSIDPVVEYALHLTVASG